MKKYWFLVIFFFLFAAVFVVGVYVCPDFMFLQSYRPNFESLDFVAGAYTTVISLCVIFSLFLFSFLVWDLFKSKISGKEPDKNKNEIKE